MAIIWCVVEGVQWHVLKSSGRRVEAYGVELVGEELLSVAIAKCLKDHGYRDEGVLLGLAASRAASAVITPELEEVRRDPQAMALVLESELPWAAEEFVADFVAEGTQFVGVAVQWAGVQELVQGLEAAGVWVQSISPWSLVRTQALVRTGLPADVFVVLAEEGAAASLVAIRGHQLTAWEWLPARDVAALCTRMGLMHVRWGTAESQWAFVGLEKEILAALREAAGETPSITESVEDTARLAERILSGKVGPWVEWRRGALADSQPYRSVRRLGLFAAVWGVSAIALLIAAIHLRAGQYEAQALEHHAALTQLFEALLPGQRVPVGVRVRLESELVKLKAETGSPEATAQLVSAPEILERSVTALPESIRLRVRTIDVNGVQVVLDCETLSLTDSAILVESFTRAGFEVTAPRTELVNGLVPLKLIANWKGPQIAASTVSPGDRP